MNPTKVAIKTIRGVEDHDAWDVGVHGLVVYPSRTDNGHECWGLVHVRSGSVLPSGYMSPEAAVAAAMALDHIDWTLPGSAFQDRWIKAEIFCILDDHGFDVNMGVEPEGGRDLTDVAS